MIPKYTFGRPSAEQHDTLYAFSPSIYGSVINTAKEKAREQNLTLDESEALINDCVRAALEDHRSELSK